LLQRTRNGFTPALREQLYRRFRNLEIPNCPFVNLPEARGGRWEQGLTAEKMKECRWLQPKLVGQFEFVEWTPDRHLRHSRFMPYGRTRRHTTCGGRPEVVKQEDLIKAFKSAPGMAHFEVKIKKTDTKDKPSSKGRNCTSG
jgi:hypothetical protein